MTPGLAFFYGGLVESTTVLNTLMMSYVCAALITVRDMLYTVQNDSYLSMRLIRMNHIMSLLTLLLTAPRAVCPDSIRCVRLLVYFSWG